MPDGVVLVSPNAQGLCIAASCRERYPELHAGGRKLVEQTLHGLPEGVRDLLVVLPDVEAPKAVHRELVRLARGGARIHWCAPTGAAKVAEACRGVTGVDLHMGKDLADAFVSQFHPDARPPLLRDFEGGNQDLEDFLRYKVSLYFMGRLDPAPLRLAAAELAKTTGPRGKAFSLDRLPTDERTAVEGFRLADFPYLEGKGPAVAALKERVRAVGPTDLSVLVVGETGTGKEAVAFYLHDYSSRRTKPFVSINCAGLNETFLRSELFGHEEGAFTGATEGREGLVALAEGGTLFLDELGDMVSTVQADLLRFLQMRTYRRLGGTEQLHANVRIVAAGQPSLLEGLGTSGLRRDLYHRIAEVELRTPALRDMGDDLIRVVRHLVFRLQRQAPDRLRDALRYFEERVERLARHSWPGNVRELAALVKRRMLLGDDVVAELDASCTTGGGDGAPDLRTPADLRRLDDVLRDYVARAAEVAARNHLTQAELAKRLDVAVNTLKRHLRASAPDRKE